MTEPFTFTLTTPSQASLALSDGVNADFTLATGVNATFTLNAAASHRNVAEWLAAEAVLYLDARYPTGF